MGKEKERRAQSIKIDDENRIVGVVFRPGSIGIGLISGNNGLGKPVIAVTLQALDASQKKPEDRLFGPEVFLTFEALSSIDALLGQLNHAREIFETSLEDSV